jgi:chemotaxis family two-component system sensor kinase Cph1
MIRLETSFDVRPRVLVVEDALIVANEIARILAELGCEVVGPVGTVQKAEALARTEDVDAALLDINLQNEPVYPAAEILMTNHVPVAFLTGYSRKSLPDRYWAVPCLEKPFSTDELMHVLQDSLGIGITH